VRVFHVDSARTWRGGQNQVLLTAAGMQHRGHRVTVVCQAGGELETRAREAGLDVRGVRFRGDLSPGATLALARLLRREPPDAMQLHDPHAAAAGALAARLAGARLTLATRRVDFPLRGGLSLWKYRSTQGVIAVSRAIASVLVSAGIPSERVRLVYEGVRDRPPQPGGRELLGELGVPRDAPVVGNVAALTGHKDHATLIQAAARVVDRLPEARFVVVGEGQLRTRLQAQVRDLGLERNWVFAGFRNDLDRLLPAFTVFCLSSHLEGLGTSLLDAMCFARPVVATAAGGIPEAVVDGVTGHLVPVRDAAALADALVHVLRDADTRTAMGRAGRQRFEEQFTEDRMVEATLGVYRELHGGDEAR